MGGSERGVEIQIGLCNSEKFCVGFMVGNVDITFVDIKVEMAWT